MSYTIQYNPSLRVIETEGQGLITAGEAEKIMCQVADLAQREECFVCLGDYRLAAISMSVYEIYQLPLSFTKIATGRGLNSFSFKGALVVATLEGDYHFFERVIWNAGQKLRLFLEMESARNWLLEK